VPPLPRLDARHVRAAFRRSSTLPIQVDTDDGAYVVKLRGAAQGVRALTAEVIVAELAEALGLAVPARALIRITPPLPTDDRDQELGDLVRASAGWNLGLRHLPGARELTPVEIATLDEAQASRIAWLDGLVMNVDRTTANPNLLAWGGRVWLIDHGAALPFQYAWAEVTEAHPRRAGPPLTAHALRHRATRVAMLDDALAATLSRRVIEAAVARVPDELLAPPPGGALATPARLRAAYVAFLWKRLAPPRPWVPGG
jgi:hypothetical protein